MPQPDILREIYRCSRLDEYRAYLSGEHFDGSEYTALDFVDRMTTKQKSRAMDAGTAVHKLIETAGFGELPEKADVDGWRVHFDLNAELQFPKAREVELQRTHRSITLFGKVDGMDDLAVHDSKTTAAIDIDRYMDSYQWRGYLWLSGRPFFVYDIFKVKVDDIVDLVTVQDYVPIKLARYPGMDKDVTDLLEEFDAAVKALGICEIAMKKAA